MSSTQGESRSWLLTIVLACGVLVGGFMLYRWWVQRGEDNRLRDASLPACIADMGEAVCRDHITQNHDDCARLTRHHPGRFSSAPEAVDSEAYLRCVELGVDAWVASKGRQAEAAAHERQPNDWLGSLHRFDRARHGMRNKTLHGRRRLLQGALGFGLSAVGCGAPRATSEVAPTSTDVTPTQPSASASAPPTIQASAEQVLEIGVVLTLTGPQAAFGRDTQDGIQFAVKQLPAHEAIRGRRVKFLVADDEGSARTGVERVRDLASRPGLIAIIGSVQSSIARLTAREAQSAGVPFISPAATSREVTRAGDFAFRVCFIDDDQGTMAARYAIDKLARKKLALVFCQDDPYSQAIAQAFEKKAKELGAAITITKTFARADSDFRNLIHEVAAKKPDLCFVPVYYNQMASIAKAIDEARLPHELFLGTDGWSDPSFYPVFERGTFIDHWAEDNPDPRSKQFVAALLEAGRAPTSLTVMGNDATLLLFDAIGRATELSRIAVRDALAATHSFEGVSGPLSFDADRNPIKKGVALQIKDGKAVWVATVER